MNKQPPSLIERRDAAQATLDRFLDQPFQWGKWDCVRLAAFNLRLLGYRPALSRGGTYKSALGAARALLRAGHRDLAAALDSQGLLRIPPAAALAGDIIMVPAEYEFGGSIHVAVGNGRTVGYHQDAPGATVLQPLEFVAAWRV